MKTISSLLLTLGFAATTLISGVASARSLPAIAGHAYYPSNESCFFPQSGWASVSNSCNSTLQFVVPLENTLTSSGSVTVKADAGYNCTALICPAAAPSCTAYQVNADGNLVTSYTASLTKGNTTIGTFSSVAPTDTLHLVCEIAGTNSSQPLGLMSVSW
jgi:hypothetical protein